MQGRAAREIMKHPRSPACPPPIIADRIPVFVRAWMQPFRACFTAPVWEHVLVRVMGAVLAPGKRTVTAALRVMGLDAISNFTRYHQVLNRARWSSQTAARCLLEVIVTTLVGEGPVVIGLDDTIERRWGPKIAARGIYRDPVRSSKEHFVKTSGLRWLSFMVLAPIPWAKRVWALPFLSILAPSERYHAERGRRHKTLTDWARQAILCVCRWLPRHRVVFVGDSSFAVLELLAAVRERCCVISRLRLDANLFAPIPPCRPTKRGRRPVKGPRLPKLKKRLTDAATVWRTVTLTGWYGNQTRTVVIASDVAVWYRGGSPPITLRWVLVRDPTGEREPQAFFSTDPELDPVLILTYFGPAMAGRGHLLREPCPPRGRDSAPMVGPRHPAHHAGAPGFVFLDHRVGDGALRCWGRAPRRVLVRQDASDVQRCHRRCALPPVVAR